MVLKIYNALGQIVRTLVDEIIPPGMYKITWDGLSNSRKLVASGMYLVQMTAESIVPSNKEKFNDTRQMILMR
ncbi:MAG: FlgD immunoglobulin-like domain containing protein [bacterium]